MWADIGTKPVRLMADVDVDDPTLAAGLRESLGGVSGQAAELDPADRERARDVAYFTDPIDAPDAGTTGSYSTDSGDVSQVVPLGGMRVATWPVGTPPHSWQAVAAGGSTGTVEMIYAAKTIGGTLGRLLTDPDLLAEAVAEFEDRGGADGYESPMPDDTDPYGPFGIDRPEVDFGVGGDATVDDDGTAAAD